MVEKVNFFTAIFILCSNLTYSQAYFDIKNFANGNVKTFNSKGHSKAKGLEFSIKYLDNC
jgi:hypothetical protein